MQGPRRGCIDSQSDVDSFTRHFVQEVVFTIRTRVATLSVGARLTLKENLGFFGSPN